MENIRGSAHGPAPANHSGAPSSGGAGPVQFRPTPTQEKKSKRLPLIIGAIVALALIALVVTYFLRAAGGGGSGIDSSKYQAVFFTNGQVYFGKLQHVSDDYMKLTDIYYLQTQEQAEKEEDAKNPQQTSGNENIQLIKLGEEIHGPEDEMTIVRDQVLFYENIKTDGQVAKKIEEFKKK